MSESTPDGKSQHDAGAKLDYGKNRVALVMRGFARALWHVSLIGTFGANKYSDNGWMTVENGQERYADAMWRHELKEAMGEEVDPDSDILHAAHKAWNALAELDLMLRERERRDQEAEHYTRLAEFEMERQAENTREEVGEWQNPQKDTS